MTLKNIENFLNRITKLIGLSSIMNDITTIKSYRN